MKVSVCITVFNEEESISSLLDSLVAQSKRAEEIIIVDGGSTDRTLQIIRHYQKRYKYIKLLAEKCTRARGRNLSVELANNEIVAITDAGCIADTDWLKNITKPFETGKIDIAAGFYRMKGVKPIQKAMSIFLGVTPKKFNMNFLPSTRSMAFTKKAWEAVGGFPEGMVNSAEDTDFNYKAVKLGLKYSRVKNAEVEWGMPKTLREFRLKIEDYSKWDVKYGIWWHPAQGFMSHNIKVVLVLLRYILALILLVFGIRNHLLLACLGILFFIYLIWAFRKIFLEFRNWEVSLWGPLLQITADLAVMKGFISGIIG